MNNKKYLLKAKSYKSNNFKDPSHIQADVTTLNFYIFEQGYNKSKIIFEFSGDLKGWMPSWLSNIIQKKWPYRFLEALRKEISEQNAKG